MAYCEPTEICAHGNPLNALCPICEKKTQEHWDAVKSGAKNDQVGGDHYRTMAIQPAEFCHRNGIGYMEGLAIKYLCRWKKKDGVLDLQKAVHCIQLLIEFETKPDAR